MRYAFDKTSFWRRLRCHLFHWHCKVFVPVYHSWDVICEKCGYRYLSED